MSCLSRVGGLSSHAWLAIIARRLISRRRIARSRPLSSKCLLRIPWPVDSQIIACTLSSRNRALSLYATRLPYFIFASHLYRVRHDLDTGRHIFQTPCTSLGSAVLRGLLHLLMYEHIHVLGLCTSADKTLFSKHVTVNSSSSEIRCNWHHVHLPSAIYFRLSDGNKT